MPSNEVQELLDSLTLTEVQRKERLAKAAAEAETDYLADAEQWVMDNIRILTDDKSLDRETQATIIHRLAGETATEVERTADALKHALADDDNAYAFILMERYLAFTVLSKMSRAVTAEWNRRNPNHTSADYKPAPPTLLQRLKGQ